MKPRRCGWSSPLLARWCPLNWVGGLVAGDVQRPGRSGKSAGRSATAGATVPASTPGSSYRPTAPANKKGRKSRHRDNGRHPQFLHHLARLVNIIPISVLAGGAKRQGPPNAPPHPGKRVEQGWIMVQHVSTVSPAATRLPVEIMPQPAACCNRWAGASPAPHRYQPEGN